MDRGFVKAMSRYRYVGSVTVQDLGFAVSTALHACRDCGAVVADEALHDTFHAAHSGSDRSGGVS